MEKKRIKIEVAYDGSGYCGWQIQPQAPTIENTLNQILSRVLKEEIKVAGASRTDAGVHALGNVAVFDTSTPIPPDKIRFAVNPFLPEDIRIISSCRTADDFHPRYCDSIKTYDYHIQTGPAPLPTYRRYSHWIPREPDLAPMQEAAAYLTGRHDFQSFCAAGAQVKTTIRKVTRIDIQQQQILPGFSEIIFSVSGEGFLYNMVRILTGTLLKIGFAAWPPEYVKSILDFRDRRQAGETLPAKGLCLRKILFL